MTPGIKAEDVCFGFGDYFLNQEDVQEYFPNIIFLPDTFHFCSSKKDKCILLIDFGKNWNIIQNDFCAAVYAKTENECLVSASLVCAALFHFHELSTRWAKIDRRPLSARISISNQLFIFTNTRDDKVDNGRLAPQFVAQGGS